MQTILIAAGAVIAIVAIWLTSVAVWMKKQNLVGSWVAALSDGTHVTLQFEGDQRGGIYKQLTRTEAGSTREFGHWTINLSQLKFIIMASDKRDHPRLGIDTQFWLTWEGKDRIVIDGPDRPKWTFTRATDDVKVDFDAGTFGEPAAASNGGPEVAANSQLQEEPPSI